VHLFKGLVASTLGMGTQAAAGLMPAATPCALLAAPVAVAALADRIAAYRKARWLKSTR